LVTIGYSGAANSVGSLSPRAATLVPQMRARVGEGWGEGRFCQARSCSLHPPSPRRFAATLSHKGRGYDPAARVELIEPSRPWHELTSGRQD